MFPSIKSLHLFLSPSKKKKKNLLASLFGDCHSHVYMTTQPKLQLSLLSIEITQMEICFSMLNSFIHDYLVSIIFCFK